LLLEVVRVGFPNFITGERNPFTLLYFLWCRSPAFKNRDTPIQKQWKPYIFIWKENGMSGWVPRWREVYRHIIHYYTIVT
jgi:hypothetical protein